MNAESTQFILSQDYELFFHDSGSVEKCLFEPCAALLEFAAKQDSRITFFVDAGMLRCMQRHAAADRAIRRTLDQVKSHVSSLADAGHEIALHVHPHWEDSRWTGSGWDFAGTRYQFRDFSDDEIRDIFHTYAAILSELQGRPVTGYRAGGFCVEPFERIGPALAELGIFTDSSVLPGAYLADAAKGFDFRRTPPAEWWRFDESPSVQDDGGPFLELPISSQRLPFLFYWGRMLERIGAARPSGHFGDGSSKRIGKREIARRLLGASRAAELSIDDPKAGHLLRPENLAGGRRLLQVMGHPKLLSRRSLEVLGEFMSRAGLRRFDTMGAVADRVRAGGPAGI